MIRVLKIIGQRRTLSCSNGVTELISKTKIATNLTLLAGAIVTLPLQATVLLDFDDHAHAANGGYAKNDFSSDIFIQSSSTIINLSEDNRLPLSNLTKALEQLGLMVGEDPNGSLMQGPLRTKIGERDLEVEKWARLVECAKRASKVIPDVIWPWDVQNNGKITGTLSIDDSGWSDFGVTGGTEDENQRLGGD